MLPWFVTPSEWDRVRVSDTRISDLPRPPSLRLPFRLLVRKYGCDLACTPMIVSESFVQSAKARDVEFTTCDGTTL